MRTGLVICTEADYLQAQITFLGGESRGRNPTLHKVKQQVRSILKKGILGNNPIRIGEAKGMWEGKARWISPSV